MIDGRGSRRCVLFDGSAAKLATEDGWNGIIVNGCIRDSMKVNLLNIGISALHCYPLNNHGKSSDDQDVQVNFAGVNFNNGTLFIQMERNHRFRDELGLK